MHAPDPVQVAHDTSHAVHVTPSPGLLSNLPAAQEVHAAPPGPEQAAQEGWQEGHARTPPTLLEYTPAGAHEVHAVADPAQVPHVLSQREQVTASPLSLSKRPGAHAVQAVAEPLQEEHKEPSQGVHATPWADASLS